MRGRKQLKPLLRKALGIGFGVFLLLLWQLIAVAIGKSFILPKPVEVLGHIIENENELFMVHLPATMQVVAVGGLLAVILGFLLATAMDWDHRLEKALYPLLTVTQTIPTICIAPVFVLWFGYTVKMRIIVVVLVNFFSVTVNVFDGFRATSAGRMELMQTYGAGRLQQFLLLRLPTALPSFFTALRIAVPWSVVGATVAEWLGAPDGLGTYSRSCMMNLDAAGLLAPLLILTGCALILNGLLKWIEKRVITWQGEA
ncbi:MAG: ABC transporter permease [Lachnospiraceae bacterium]|nr:ABC transporter permease [Lachnospiraceae bacterium]